MFVFLRKKFYGKSSIEKISQYMGDEKILVTTNPDKISPSDVLIRWGNTEQTAVLPRIEINSAKSILLASNKLLARKMCGVTTPRSFGFGEELPEDFVFPALVRPLHHTQGRNMRIVEKPYYPQKFEYIQEILKKTREFRVFIAGNAVFGVIEKIPANKCDLAWNHAAGGKFIAIKKAVDIPLDACILAIQASKNLGLDFCAIDVIFDEEEFFFLEANTAFTVASESRARRLANYFLACKDEKYTQESNFSSFNTLKINL